MSLFKKIASGVKTLVKKVFGAFDKKLTSAVEKEFEELEKTAVNPAVESTTSEAASAEEEDEFLAAIKLAEERGEDFKGSDINEIYKYERVQSWLDFHGYVDEVREAKNSDAE